MQVCVLIVAPPTTHHAWTGDSLTFPFLTHAAGSIRHLPTEVSEAVVNECVMVTLLSPGPRPPCLPCLHNRPLTCLLLGTCRVRCQEGA